MYLVAESMFSLVDSWNINDIYAQLIHAAVMFIAMVYLCAPATPLRL